MFTSHELDGAFRRVFDLVYSQEPEAFPFRQPVDPKLLGIPVRQCILCCYSNIPRLHESFDDRVPSLILQDYFEIIKKPIDLSTINRKLTDGSYKDGWEVREREGEGGRE